MLDLLVAEHGIGPSFWGVPSCFYRRTDDFEVVFCLPFTESCSSSVIGICLYLGGHQSFTKAKKQKYLTL